MFEDPREALVRLAAARGVSLAALSAMLGRNAAYLQQYVARGSPRRLAEEDRRALAAFLGVEEVLLGGTEARTASVPVPWLAVEAAAGAGADARDERVLRAEPFAPETLAAAGIAARNASLIAARGDSMEPTIMSGDRLLVDLGDRRVARRPAIFVLRRDGDLLVKRISRTGDAVTIASDNPAYSPLTLPVIEVEVIGRVKLLLRGLT
ncbi:MAG: S24 family peptidase [Sphingomonas bacterium]